MMEQLKDMIRKASRAKEIIDACSDQIKVVSHYDADGICSAAIMTKALIRRGKDFHLAFIQQINEDILMELEAEKRKVIIFLDLGSGYLNDIKNYLNDSDVIICDHHQPVGDAGRNVTEINSVSSGIDGNISGAGVTYLLARTMSSENIDLASLAIVGAIGDSQIDSVGKDWGLNGLNMEIVKDAENKGKLKVSKGLRIWGRYSRPLHKALQYSIDPYIPGISGSESSAVQFLTEIGIPVKKNDGEWNTISDLTIDQQKRLATEIIKERIRGNHNDPDVVFGDVYELLDKPGIFRDASEFATVLNACGKMDRASLGVSVCLNRPDSFEEVKKVVEKYRSEIGKAISWIYRQIDKKTERIRIMNGVYILAGDAISEHFISNATSTVSHSGILPDKPIFGLANAERGIKISARASQELVDKGMRLNEIMNTIASKYGTEGGGHMAASGATIPAGKEEEFIKMTEELISVREDGKKEETEAKEPEEKQEDAADKANKDEEVIKTDNFIIYDNKNKEFESKEPIDLSKIDMEGNENGNEGKTQA
ncbi:MAG: DHH family phosphoesterase [Candidatus Aenigmarchaeota archaeon]|nr:DHH family phosphoesterase [Candidatus Aenigmarchaeota archaeon]